MLTLVSGGLKVKAASGSDSQMWMLDFETGCFRSKTSETVGLLAKPACPDVPDCHESR